MCNIAPFRRRYALFTADKSHCGLQMLLFTAKKETPDMWRALAARFRNAIGFALVSCTSRRCMYGLAEGEVVVSPTFSSLTGRTHKHVAARQE